MTTGIDISHHNKSVDWNITKNHIDFAILRAGYGRYASQKDTKFETFYSGAKNAGIPIGAYWYSYATSVEEVKSEANACLTCILDKTFEYPIYFDIEDSSQANLGIETITSMCITFCEIIGQASFLAGIYANTDWFLNRIDKQMTDQFTKWLADYRANPNTTLPRDIHQYTSKGSVPGVVGNVDMNNCYRDFLSETGNKNITSSSDVVVLSTVNNLAIRNAPSIYGEKIGVLHNGDAVDVINDLNGGSWIQIKSSNTIGYIARQYTTGANGTNILNDLHIVGKVTANSVYLRSAPSKSSAKIAILNNQDLFDVVDDLNGGPWIYIRYNEMNGYIARQYTNGANGNNIE